MLIKLCQSNISITCKILKCGKSKMGQACESNDLPTCHPFKTLIGVGEPFKLQGAKSKLKILLSNFDVQQSQGIPSMTHILKHQKLQLTGIVNTFLCRLQNSVLGILTAPSTSWQLQKISQQQNSRCDCYIVVTVSLSWQAPRLCESNAHCSSYSLFCHF